MIDPAAFRPFAFPFEVCLVLLQHAPAAALG